MLKRSVDILAALIGGVIFLGPILLICGAVILRMGRPVFFTQDRAGKDGRVFRIIKFRTMTSGTNADGNLLPDAERTTALGRFLRKTRLDELPELWNILIGHMSLIGPRPLLPQYLPEYTARQSERHHMRPGLTGWAQVNGNTSLSRDTRVALDLWYVDHASLLLDAKILLKTMVVVIFGEQINEQNVREAVRHAYGTDWSGN